MYIRTDNGWVNERMVNRVTINKNQGTLSLFDGNGDFIGKTDRAEFDPNSESCLYVPAASDAHVLIHWYNNEDDTLEEDLTPVVAWKIHRGTPDTASPVFLDRYMLDDSTWWIPIISGKYFSPQIEIVADSREAARGYSLENFRDNNTIIRIVE